MRKFLILAVALVSAIMVRGDQIEMKNGDRYIGKVVSLTADTVVLENDVLGKITVPRAKVSLLSVGVSAPLTAPAATPPVLSTNVASATPVNPNTPIKSNEDISAALRQLGANTNFVAKIKQQFLSQASPDANQQFDQTLAGLTSGNIDLAGLRAQAKSAADELRSYQKQLGPDAGDTMNTYLTILDNFLNETSTNR